VGLEIISRLCHFFVQQDPAGFDAITTDLPPSLREAVSDASAIPDLLRDMRPLLNELNKNNPNVFSFPAQSFRIATTWKKIDTERTLDAEGYLDLCRDCVCYNLLNEEVLVRFTYQTIHRVHFDEQTNSIEVRWQSNFLCFPGVDAIIVFPNVYFDNYQLFVLKLLVSLCIYFIGYTDCVALLPEEAAPAVEERRTSTSRSLSNSDSAVPGTQHGIYSIFAYPAANIDRC